MTTHDQDKVIAAALKSGLGEEFWLSPQHPNFEKEINMLERFYAIAFETGRQLEREECAKVCESTYPEYGGDNPYCFETPSECAEAIRARSTE